MLFFCIIILLFLLISTTFTFQLFPDDGDYRYIYPTVCIGFNIPKGFDHTLSYHFGLLENIMYPKDRMHIAFYVNSSSMPSNYVLTSIDSWSKMTSNFYLSILLNEYDINWYEDALMYSRRKSCAYLFLTNTNAFLRQETLKKLIDLNEIVVSPLIKSPFNEYSNAYGLLGANFVNRQDIGKKRVYFSNEPLLINLKHTDSSYLSFSEENFFNYHGSSHPIDVFAYGAYSMNISIFIDNFAFYGYFIDSIQYQTYDHHRIAMNVFLANLVSDMGPMPLLHSSIIEPQFLPPIKFGFDAIYIINLERRPERLRKMVEISKLLGLDVQIFSAVDGQLLTEDELRWRGIRLMAGYLDPFYKRPMKKGEIGCFLSHFEIWQRMVNEGIKSVIVLEDDTRFTHNSIEILNDFTEDLVKTRLDWEFIYLGRKKMTDSEEMPVTGHRYLRSVTYSYWTLGYAISIEGAKKLLSMNPLERLIPVDEFLPIAYGQHPNDTWSKQFEPHELLKAYTVFPLIVEPNRYSNQPDYSSDTEDSEIFPSNGNVSIKEYRNDMDGRKLESNVQLNVALIKDEL